MTEIDWIIAALLVLSTIVGTVRGVVRETLSIAGWVLGVMAALSFAGETADLIPLESIGYIPRVIIAAVLIVVIVLFGIGLLGVILRKLLEAAEISFEDRALGAVFGLVRGVVVVCGVVFLAGMLESVQTSKMWRQSILIAPAEIVINWSLPFLPSSIAEMRADAKPGPLEDAARSVIDKINL